MTTAITVAWTLASGVVTSGMASLIVLFVIYLQKPKLVISPKVAKTFDHKGTPIYEIKVASVGRRPVGRIQARLYLKTAVERPGGPVYYWDDVRLVRSEILLLKPATKSSQKEVYRPVSTNELCKPIDGDGAATSIRFRTVENLEHEWLDHRKPQILYFEVTATDVLTQIGAVYHQEYLKGDNPIVAGDFCYGCDMKIVPRT